MSWKALIAAGLVVAVAAWPACWLARYVSCQVTRWRLERQAARDAAGILRGRDLDSELEWLFWHEGCYYGQPEDDLMALADEVFGEGEQ